MYVFVCICKSVYVCEYVCSRVYIALLHTLFVYLHTYIDSFVLKIDLSLLSLLSELLFSSLGEN